MTDTEQVVVAHDRVSGRVRLRARALKGQPGLAPLLERELRACAGVRELRLNPITGSVLVHFDPARVTPRRLQEWAAGWLNGPGRLASGRRSAASADQGVRGGEAASAFPTARAVDGTRKRRGRRAAPSRSGPEAASSALSTARRWAARSVGEALVALDSAPTGLTPAVATRRRARDGANQLPEPDQRSTAQILKDQLVSVPTLMLLGAVGLSVATGGLVDAAVIAAVLALNGGIGFGTERYAEGAIRALQRLGSPRATVLRDSHTYDVPGADVVVGDVVRLRSGDVVPADGRVIESHALTVDEAPLTGESIPVPKIREPIAAPTAIAECRNLIFMGTAVATGHGRAVVTATGARTQIGRINALVGGEAAPRTRMQDGLDDLAKRLGVGTLGVCGGLFLVGVLLGLPSLPMLQTAVALAISAVPEGLPAVATTALAIGMARMLRRQVVIRKLPAVEALGGVSVLCVDKTGTLTLNRMQLVEVYLDGRFLPFRPIGDWDIGRVPTITPPRRKELPETLLHLLEVGVLCNEADLEIGSRGLRVRGSSTEGALLLAARNCGFDTAALGEAYSLIDIRHRETGNPLMATLHETPSGGFRLCVKGAPETVLGVCSHALERGRRVRLTAALRGRILAANEDMASRGLRVLGYAEAERDAPEVNGLKEGGLTWLGLSGMEDPLRPGVTESIARCREAGIRTVILTGDHPATARAVAAALGIAQNGGEHVAEASALLDLPPEQLRATVSQIDVYARVSPEDKLRIVRALQSNGEVVAMTGDGVNDGPAMKAADVGIAMGRQGTEVAKEIADMVLLEDDFDQMAVAIEQGRTIYGNIRRSLRYLAATNLSEVITVAVALLTRVPIPLSAIQMLWMNLISDVFPALALTLEPPPADVMRRPPRPADEPLIPPEEWRTMTRDALLLATSSMAVYRTAMRRHGPGPVAQSVSFTAAALAEIVYALACGSPIVREKTFGRTTDRDGNLREGTRFRPNSLLLGTVAGTAGLQMLTLFVPPLRRLLQLAPLDRQDWNSVVMGAVLPVVLASRRRRQPAPAAGTGSLVRLPWPGRVPLGPA